MKPKTTRKPSVGETPEPNTATPKPETCRLDEQKPVCGCARPVLLEPEKKKK
jgi:hypothetical protein